MGEPENGTSYIRPAAKHAHWNTDNNDATIYTRYTHIRRVIVPFLLFAHTLLYYTFSFIPPT